MKYDLEKRTLLTIAIPTFNRGQILYKNILKLLENKSRDFSVLVSDNCSTDDTKDLILSIDDERLEYTCNRENIGAVKNINSVLGKAMGQYVYLISDEDIISKNGLYKIIETISQGSLYSAILGDIKSEDSSLYYSRIPSVYKNNDAIRTFLFDHPYISGIIYKREIIQEFSNSKFLNFIYPHEVMLAFCLTRGYTLYLGEIICCRGEIQDCSIEKIGNLHFTHPTNRVKQYEFKVQFLESLCLSNDVETYVKKKLDVQAGQAIAFSLLNFYPTITLTTMIDLLRLKNRKLIIVASFIVQTLRLLKSRLKVILK